MLSPRVYNILKFFSEQSEPLFISETNFEFNEIIELRNEGYLLEEIKTHYQFEGAIPCGKNAYLLSQKGKDAILLHDQELKRIAEEHFLNRSSNRWAIIAAWVSIASLLATIVSILLPLLLNR